MRLFAFVWILGLLALAAPASATEAGSVLIDFETFPNGDTIEDETRITTQFASKGVSFFMTTDENGPQIVQFDAEGQSGDNVLAGAGGSFDLYQPIKAVFGGVTSSVSVVALDVGENGIILEAFQRGVLVDSDSVAGTERGDGVGYADTLSVSAFAIDTVVIRQITPGQIGEGFWIDDFEFETVWDPNGGFGPNDRPTFLILSLADDFDTSGCDCDCEDDCTCGSGTVIVEIGTFVAGYAVGDTRFDLNNVGDVPEDLDLDGNEATVIGCPNTTGPNTIHLVSPNEEEIPQKVQEAFFFASPFFDQIPGFPEASTIDIAQFIFDTAAGLNPVLLEDQDGEGPDQALTMQQILDHVFVTEAIVEAPEDAAFAEAEGDLFPHDPDEPLFGFAFQIDPDDGDLSIGVCLTVPIDIKPGNSKNVVNHKSNGVVWVAVLTKPGFDAPDEVDEDTVYLGGALAKQSKVKDANDDGSDDLLLKFDVEDIGLTADTAEVELTGDLLDDKGCFAGTDLMTTVPSGKGKKK